MALSASFHRVGENVLALLNLLDGMGRLSGVVDDAGSELRGAQMRFSAKLWQR